MTFSPWERTRKRADKNAKGKERSQKAEEGKGRKFIETGILAYTAIST